MKTLLFLFAAVIATPVRAEDATPDQQARFLAGLSVEGTPLEAIARESGWQSHARGLENSWSELDKRQLSKIREWAPQVLAKDAASADPMIYFFSGPDFLYANTFFQNASTYVLCGLEPVGTPPDVTKLKPGAISASLGNLRKSLDAVLSFSFFKTKDMKEDLKATQLSGTLPVIYVFLARLGNHLQSIELVSVDDEGKVTADSTKPSGAKITFARDGGKIQTLYYFSTDLSNEGIRKHPGFTRFCASLGNANSLVKAASYLMHEDYFSASRDFLLAHCKLILEDDSGIPLKHFAQGQWDIACLGHYAGPIDMFKKSYQTDLANAFKKANPEKLTFSYGYRWHSNESSVILATKLTDVPKATLVKP